jgi:hypothetical protein
MSSNTFTGPAAMLGPCLAKAPYFSGQQKDSLAEFLQEYDTLADGHKLSGQEKVECILWYIPLPLRNFWQSLNGFGAGDQAAFHTALERIYPDTAAATCYTRNSLMDFIDVSSRSRMCDEDDVVEYYQHFLILSNLLHQAQELSDCKRDIVFLQGFHPDIHERLSSHLFTMDPRCPACKPYGFEDVYTAA